MLSYLWPIALVVVANTVYQICARSVPEKIDPFASLTVTYLVSAALSAILYLLLHRGGNLIEEYRKLNWAPFVFGIILVALEAGYIYAYKAGWQVSTAAIVQSAFLGIVLLFVGFLVYHEALTWNKIAGIIVCFVGLALINLRK